MMAASSKPNEGKDKKEKTKQNLQKAIQFAVTLHSAVIEDIQPNNVGKKEEVERAKLQNGGRN